MKLEVNLCGMKLKNPIIAASGTFGYGYEFDSIYDINVLGSISLKGTTKEKRYGNPLPRIAETKCGMLNCVGLQNSGIDGLINHELPMLTKIYTDKVIANIGGSEIDDYVYSVEKASNQDAIGAIELNISCPNVKCGGIAYGTDPSMAAELTRAVKLVSKKPIIVKLSPNVTDIVSIAKAVEKAGADAVSLINTLLGLRLDYKTGKPILSNVYGGVSGGCVFPVALRMVHQVSKNIGIPVVGMGGIETAKDVIEMMSAGATAVMIGSSNLVNPYAMKNIIEELPDRLKEIGVDDINELIARSHKY